MHAIGRGGERHEAKDSRQNQLFALAGFWRVRSDLGDHGGGGGRPFSASAEAAAHGVVSDMATQLLDENRRSHRATIHPPPYLARHEQSVLPGLLLRPLTASSTYMNAMGQKQNQASLPR